MTTENKKLKIIERQFRVAYNERKKDHDLRCNWEEFYFNDVQDTKTQLTTKQLTQVKTTYNIPISTKLTYPIVEQILSFLTSMKPFPKLVASQETFQDVIIGLGDAYAAVWYECHAYQEMKLALRDMLLVGLGAVYVRNNAFYNESTFNTIIEYIHWKHIVIDPNSRKEDMSDAEYIILADVMHKSKAEKIYDIKLSDEDVIDDTNMELSMSDFGGVSEVYDGMDMNDDTYAKGRKSVRILNHFSKEEVNLYLSDQNDLSNLKPIPAEIPNPAYAELEGQLNELLSQQQQGRADGKAMQQQAQDAETQLGISADPQENIDNTEVLAGSQEAGQLANDQNKDLNATVKQIKQQLAVTPKVIDGYMFRLNDDTEYPCENYERIVRKQIKRTLIVGKKIVETEVLPLEKYPIIFFTFNHLQSPNKIYGVPHYIQDLVRAQNKYWSMLLHDMQTNGHRKVIYFENTVSDPSSVESRWATPGAWIGIKGDPSLPDGGRPTVVEPSGTNTAIQFILQSFKDLIEYVVGLFAINQGDPSQAPQTFGATMNIQSFGNQRVKLYSRNLERSLEDLAYVTCCMLNAYAPKDKVLKYINPDGNPQDVKLIPSNEDLQFKVRVDITNTMPTQRQMFAQLLSNVIAQTRNQGMSDLLTETMLKVLDMPESLEVAKKIDVVQNLQGQVSGLQDDVKKKDGIIQSLQYQIALKDSSAQIQKLAEKAKGDIKSKAAQELAAMSEQGDEAAQEQVSSEVPPTEEAQMYNQEESMF